MIAGNLTALADVFTEGVSGQFVDLTLAEAGTGTPINTAAVTAVTATLKSRDTGAAIFTAATDRHTLLGASGVVRITFTAADMIALGGKALQRRELLVEVTHSGGKVWRQAVIFTLGDL